MRIVVCSLIVFLSSQAMATDDAKPAAKKEEPAKPSAARVAEDTIRDGMKEKHVTMSSVKCPDDADYTGIKAVTCSGTDDDGTKSDFTVTITSTSEKTTKTTKTHAEMNWSAQKSIVDEEKLGPKMSESLSRVMKKKVVVTCRSKAFLKKDDCSVVCDATIDGKPHKVSVASCPDAAGHMQLKVD